MKVLSAAARFIIIGVCFLNAGLAYAKGYVTAEIHHQLGNQMFEIAAAVSFAIDHKAIAYFPDLRTKKEDNIPLNHEMIFFRLETNVPNRNPLSLYQEKSFEYASIPYAPNIRLSGYFQSEKYFRHNKDKIIELFSPSSKIKKYLKKKYGDIIKDPKTIAIHIRTYYREDPHHVEFPLNGRSYIEKAMYLFPEDSHFIVFSDNIEWCKQELLGIPRNIRYIEGEAYYHDFFLMSMCQHNIISNSTFSWWAAYLNQNPTKIVVAPEKWFQPSKNFNTKDLYPPEWIVLD